MLAEYLAYKIKCQDAHRDKIQGNQVFHELLRLLLYRGQAYPGFGENALTINGSYAGGQSC